MKQYTEIDDFLCTSVHFGWFFGGRRFLVLIIKVTLSELSEASAPSMCNIPLLCVALYRVRFGTFPRIEDARGAAEKREKGSVVQRSQGSEVIWHLASLRVLCRIL